MKYFKQNETLNGDSCVNLYSGITQEALNTEVDKFFKSSGYKLKDGIPGNATYEKGNKTMRILFGAFAKHFLFQAKTYANEPDTVKVTVVKGTNGIAGGLVGMKQVKDELARISRELQNI
ncbi:MAG: hypothetical protein HY951_01910 [Bacteroidia bacterium]|nr:hypothetical protein [Bacteroidia bacterium]